MVPIVVVLGVKFVRALVLLRNLLASPLKKTYKINHSFDCNDKCLIYLLSCKSYGKQYVDNTTDHFRSRWNNKKSDVRKAESGDMENVKQKFLQSHFLQRDHRGFHKDIEVRLIDKKLLFLLRWSCFFLLQAYSCLLFLLLLYFILLTMVCSLD